MSDTGRNFEEDILWCIENQDAAGLNDWERKFLPSILQGLKQYGTLTEKQVAALDRICNKVEDLDDDSDIDPENPDWNPMYE